MIPKMEGTKLGKYEIRAALGRGAMGVVYEAWDPAIERKVAIKTVNLPAAGDAESKAMLDRFKREAPGSCWAPAVVVARPRSAVASQAEGAEAACPIMSVTP
jgi:serine/threonine protein kinase